MEDKILREVECARANGELTVAGERIIRETALKVVVDGQHYATAMILAAMEKEYVIGHLYVQGIINSASDIISLRIEDNRAEVSLNANRERRIPPEKVRSDLAVPSEDVIRCVSAILESPLFKETGAVHSAGLFLEGQQVICITEDLGRHNALDKVVGAALLKKIDFGRVLASSTGRQPTEMIVKCRNAGIPVITTKGVPTSMGVEVAEKAGITLVGLVRKDTMVVYSHPERIR